MSFKKIIIIISASLFFLLKFKAETEKECFEKVSRGIFKFNKGFDKAILRPLQLVIINYQNQFKKEQEILHLILELINCSKSYFTRSMEISR